MRKQLCDGIIEAARKNTNIVFLTGDLGFMSLEPLRDALGHRFINCGIAEQSMISIAAGMAKDGMEVWVYSIAPFLYARAYEQIRNDLCFHNLPVRLVANGGGFTYGIMGPSHHAVDDYGALLTLPGLRVIVPAFGNDMDGVIKSAALHNGPCYIRLGVEFELQTTSPPTYSPWRRLRVGEDSVMVAVGPMGGVACNALMEAGDATADLWLASELPIKNMPDKLVEKIASIRRLCVIEDHVAHGGAGAMLCQWLVRNGIHLHVYRHIFAEPALSGVMGSQDWLRMKNSLCSEGIITALGEVNRA